VLFRILRGTGIAGLAGIPYRRGVFIRPLLDVRRAQILRFLAKRKLDYVADPSNLDRHYARARIRHDVLPGLGRENPRVVEALLSLASAARGETEQPWRALLPESVYLPRRTAEIVDRLVQLGQGTRRVAVKGGAIVVRYGRVTWQAAADRPAGVATLPEAQTVAGPGEYPVADGATLEVTPFSDAPWPRGRAAGFDAAKVRWPLLLRTWQTGDRMQPRDGRGRRKLSDLFVDAKVPRDERPRLPVLCDAEGTILFVPGLRPSQTGRPDERTQRWFLVRLLR
jgi:tRNA(Ile)-lysidine synthase